MLFALIGIHLGDFMLNEINQRKIYCMTGEHTHPSRPGLTSSRCNWCQAHQKRPLQLFYLPYLLSFHYSLINIHNSLFPINLSDAFNYLIGNLCRKMLCRIIQHRCADTVFAASAVQYIDIAASFATLPESLVFC